MTVFKKVWIITRRAGFNFGSSLQAYAITYIINKLGFNNQIIDFEEYRFRGKMRLAVFDCAYIVLSIIPWVSRSVLGNLYKKFSDSFHQRRKFKAFELQYFPLTSRKYKTSADIAVDTKDCDVLICGSDQIWSPVHFCPTMFLDFADTSRTRTIAYAPSIGVSSVEKHQDEMRTLINRIECLSVREEQGARIIKDLTNRNAFVALDPTLLLETSEWINIAQKPIIDKPYILCYFLDTENVPYKFIESLRQKTGYKLINLLTNYSQIKIPEAENIGTVSPSEFLGFVFQAEYVCTNSFHGTIFSIQFSRIFFIFERFKSASKINQNSRIETLLSTLELSERLISTEEETVPELPMLDYKQVQKKISIYREISLRFLADSLNNNFNQ